MQPQDLYAVKALLNCSTTRAYDLTQAARDKVEAERDALIAAGKAEGLSNRAIARDLGIHSTTIDRKVNAAFFQPGKTQHPPDATPPPEDAPPLRQDEKLPGFSQYVRMTSPVGERWWGALRALEKVGEQAPVAEILAERYGGIAHVFDPALRDAHAWINAAPDPADGPVPGRWHQRRPPHSRPNNRVQSAP